MNPTICVKLAETFGATNVRFVAITKDKDGKRRQRTYRLVTCAPKFTASQMRPMVMAAAQRWAAALQ